MVLYPAGFGKGGEQEVRRASWEKGSLENISELLVGILNWLSLCPVASI